MEEDISNKYDDILYLKREMDGIKVHVASLQKNFQGEQLLTRVNKDLWDRVSHLFMTK